jgi:lysophospholipase L1-like esterase
MVRARRMLVGLMVSGVAAVSAPVAAGAATTEPIPSSMASTGDSITRAFNACGFYVDCTSRSWSTGDYSTVNSHYLRIKAKNAAITGKNFNDAKTGAKMVDLDGQVATAVTQGVEYVTVELGANDACTSTETGMTPVATYRAQFKAAMDRLSAGLPSARVFVASVPDVKRLWFIGKDSSSARAAWSSYKICQSLLANPTSTATVDVDRRNRVQQRVVDFNTQLAQECALHAHCLFDANAVFNYQFVLSQVSGWDYFHPNEGGQKALATTTYGAGFGW